MNTKHRTFHHSLHLNWVTWRHFFLLTTIFLLYDTVLPKWNPAYKRHLYKSTIATTSWQLNPLNHIHFYCAHILSRMRGVMVFSHEYATGYNQQHGDITYPSLYLHPMPKLPLRLSSTRILYAHTWFHIQCLSLLHQTSTQNNNPFKHPWGPSANPVICFLQVSDWSIVFFFQTLPIYLSIALTPRSQGNSPSLDGHGRRV